MKKFMFLTLGVFFIVGTLAGCGGNREIDNDNQGDFIIEDITGTYDAVIDYNDSLVDIAYQCIMSENNIPTDYEENGLDDVLAAINNTLTECQNSINQINSLGDWEGDGSLKDGIIRILELDVAYFTKFSELLPYLVNGEILEENVDVYEALVNEINMLDQQMEVANNDLENIQSSFAEKFGYELE